MEKSSRIKRVPLVLLGVAIVLTTAGFQTQSAKAKQLIVDTVPSRSKKIKDIDDALLELERSKAEVDRSLKEIDFEKIEKEVKAATQNLQLNSEKMKVQIEEAMKQVDAAKLQADIQKSLKEVEAARLKAEIEASVAKIDWDKMHKELDKAKAVDFKKIEANLEKMKPEIEKSMKEAYASLEKAKRELTAYKNFIDGLDKDGLINKKENYTIEYKSGELTINGKKQPAEVVNKYSSFLKDKKDFTLEKDGDDFNIDTD